MRYLILSLLTLAVFFMNEICLPDTAWSYIDPGTAGAAYGFLGYILAGLVVFIGFFRRKIARIFSFIFRRGKNKDLQAGQGQNKD